MSEQRSLSNNVGKMHYSYDCSKVFTMQKYLNPRRRKSDIGLFKGAVMTVLYRLTMS